jgi:hypothetical protein
MSAAVATVNLERNQCLTMVRNLNIFINQHLRKLYFSLDYVSGFSKLTSLNKLQSAVTVAHQLFIKFYN